MCCRDRAALLDDALSAINAMMRPEDEVLVVDSASRGPEVGNVARRAGARLLRCDRPGASRARNVGWRAASTPVVVFTDDDCRPRPGWTVALAAALAPDDVGFAFGRVRADRRDLPALSVLMDERTTQLHPDTTPDRLGHGANMAFRREALEDVDGFDEVLGAGAPLRASEDKDVFLRALRAGWHGRFIPQAEVVHELWRGRRAALGTAWSYGIGEGALAAKLRRMGSPASSVGLRKALRQAGTAARDGYEFGVAMELVRAAGTVAGSLRARRYELDSGRFVP